MSTTSTTSTASLTGGQTLSQADFLNLLVTQMSSQDPLNPESDTDFAAQLAQFSALQASQGTETSLSQMQANSLIGQTVTVTPSSGGAAVTAPVTGITVSSGTPELVVGGQLYQLNQVTSVTPTSDNSTQSSN